jgi:hypothetical protein
MAALEFVISLSEAKLSMVKEREGWESVVVRECLEGMGEFPDDIAALESWLDVEVRHILFFLASISHQLTSLASHSLLMTRPRTRTRTSTNSRYIASPALSVAKPCSHRRFNILHRCSQATIGDCSHQRGDFEGLTGFSASVEEN